MLTRSPSHAAALVAGVCQAICLAVFVETCTASASGDDAITPKESTTLFNGKDLIGWKLYLGVAAPIPDTAPAIEPAADQPLVWSIADGILKLDAPTAGYLVTEKAYANYKLHVEWRWPKEGTTRSNSGVLLHVHGPPAIWPACFEAQLKSGNAGEITGMGLDIPDAPVENKRKRAPHLPEVTEKPFGEWNTYDIVAQDDTLILTINGTLANQVSKLPAKSGAIALQLEGYPIEFQNIRIEPISKTKP